jgi:UDP-glucose 4-epimerase
MTESQRGAAGPGPGSGLPAYAGTRVLVLGASGFIGHRVVSALAACGASVTAAVRRESASAWLLQLGAERTTVCDAADPEAVRALVRDIRPAITFNLAGYGVDRTEGDESAAQDINALLPERLAAYLGAGPLPAWSGPRLVHTGSALEYGRAGGDLRENTRPEPTTVYGRTKLAGTLAMGERARQSGLPAVTARLFTVYGPGEHAGRLLPALLDTARTGEPVDLTAGTQRRDFVYVDDVAEGLLRLGLSEADPGEVVNLAMGRLTTVRSFVERSAGVLGIRPTLLRFGSIETRAEEMDHEPVAIERLRALTGWSPTIRIEDGVLRALAEVKQLNANV